MPSRLLRMEVTLDIVQFLLEKGAYINAQGGEFSNALQAASERGYLDIIQVLLERGADINAQGGSYGNALRPLSYGRPPRRRSRCYSRKKPISTPKAEVTETPSKPLRTEATSKLSRCSLRKELISTPKAENMAMPSEAASLKRLPPTSFRILLRAKVPMRGKAETKM